MRKLATRAILMAAAGFLPGWFTAPPLFAWFVAALDGLFRVPDPGSWFPVYLRFTFGAACLFDAQVWTPRIARSSGRCAVFGYLLIGIAGSIIAAVFWHWRIVAARDAIRFCGLVLPGPAPHDLPCLSIPITGLITSVGAALLCRVSNLATTAE